MAFLQDHYTRQQGKLQGKSQGAKKTIAAATETNEATGEVVEAVGKAMGEIDEEEEEAQPFFLFLPFQNIHGPYDVRRREEREKGENRALPYVNIPLCDRYVLCGVCRMTCAVCRPKNTNACGTLLLLLLPPPFFLRYRRTIATCTTGPPPPTHGRTEGRKDSSLPKNNSCSGTSLRWMTLWVTSTKPSSGT